MVSNDATSNSVSLWIANLRQGDQQAAQDLWTRYASRLVAVAKRKLGQVQNGIADEEDVAQLAFTSLCCGAKAGRFEDVSNRDELWWLLLAMTKRKAVDLIRRETAKKRGGGEIVRTPMLPDGVAAQNLGDLIGGEPTPEYLAIMAEQYARLMESLRDDCQRHVVVSRIEGYTVSEIAGQLGITKRSVERKLQLIRDKWSRELNSNARQGDNSSQ